MGRFLRVACLAPLFAAACADKPPSAIVIVMSSDLAFPADGKTLEIEVTRDGSTKVFQQLGLPDDAKLPGTLSLQNDDGIDESTPVRIDVRVLQGGTATVTRSAVLGMSKEKTKLLRMPLNAACKTKTCGQGLTCDAGKCVGEAVDVETLPDFVSNEAAIAAETPAGKGTGASPPAGPPPAP